MKSRNSAWHKKHNKKLAAKKASHDIRVLMRAGGSDIAEKQFKKAQERERNTSITFRQRVKYAWLRAKIKTSSQLRKFTYA